MVSAINRKLFRDLIQLKGQVISIALVVCMGVAVFIGALSTYRSLNWSQHYFYDHYRFANIFMDLKQAPNSLRKRLEELPGVSQVATRIIKFVKLDMPDIPEPAIGEFISLPKSGEAGLNLLHLRKGRWANPNHPKEILVSEAFAKEHQLNPDDDLLAVVNGRREKFRIVGIVLSPEFIYAIHGQDILPDNKHFGIMWLNHDALASAFNMEGAFNNITLSTSADVPEDVTITELDRILLPFGGLGAHGRNEQISHRFVNNEFRQLKFTATVIPGIFIVIAAFLLNMVISRLIALQRQHIAILKAMGYSDWQVGIYYLKLVGVIVILGILLGIVFGAWMGNAMTNLYKQYFVFPRFDYRFDFDLLAWSSLASFIAAYSGAILSVYWVVKLPPSVAMRPPVPPSYNNNIFDRLQLLARFSATFKMIFRSIVRRPLRNIMATMGVGCGVAIVVMGLFWNDAMNHIINTQFMLAEREHILVSFNDPIKNVALQELQQQPGVLSTEGYRVVPVRLRAGHRHYLTGLFGVKNNSKQRLLLDRNLNIIQVTPDQLYMSKGLADILRVKPGDPIQIDILEGKRNKITLTLARVIDDFIGLAAYTDFHSLNRWLEERDMVSSAGIIYDPKYEEQLYKKLKDMPHIATISSKKKVIATFEDTFAKHLIVFTLFLAGFAMVIAVGIVYNGARIVLSERSWELASLRVLGFTRNEVTRVIYGELSLQLFLGIPLGFGIGYLLATASLALMPAEVIRIPLIIETKTFAFAAMTTLLAGLISAMVVYKHIKGLDLVSVLKTVD